MRKITLWVYDGCLTSAVTGALDVFMVANGLWAKQNGGDARPLFGWRIESANGRSVTSASGMKLAVDGAIGAERIGDALWLPGIYYGRGAPYFIEALDRLQPLYASLRRAYRQGAVIAANCSAVFLLAEAKLLDGKCATTSWLLTSAFEERYPQIELQPDQLVTEDERVICSGATTSYLNLALRLVERFAGPDLATACAQILLIDSGRSQATYVTPTLQAHMQHDDRLVLRAQEKMRAHLQQPLSLRKLAELLSVSERTVIRRFKLVLGMTPTDYFQLIKIDACKRLLETSSLNLNQVCERIGYSDISSFRRLFKRETGLSPRDYRIHFARRHSGRPKRAAVKAPKRVTRAPSVIEASESR